MCKKVGNRRCSSQGGLGDLCCLSGLRSLGLGAHMSKSREQAAQVLDAVHAVRAV